MGQQGQDRDSTIYVFVDITATPGVDLVGDDCQIAFIPTGNRPVSSDWVTATILEGNIAQILVGDYNNATGITLANCTAFPCDLDVWIKLTDSPEQPVAPCGTWTVT